MWCESRGTSTDSSNQSSDFAFPLCVFNEARAIAWDLGSGRVVGIPLCLGFRSCRSNVKLQDLTLNFDGADENPDLFGTERFRIGPRE